MRKTAAALITAILMSVLALPQFAMIAEGYPPYDPDAASLVEISIFSPENNRLYNTKTLTLNFNVTVGENTDHSSIASIFYETDWQRENNTIYSFDGYFLREVWAALVDPRTFTDPISKSSQSLKLTDIPEGNHSIQIYTTVWRYSHIEKLQHVFEPYLQYSDLTMANRSNTVFFSVDTIPPKITFSSPQNVSYNSSNVQINFTVNEPFSSCMYSLDGKDNTTTTSNITLSGLLNGEHYLTIYATDNSGNIGASETLFFKVAEFPVVPVAVAVVIAVSVIAGLTLYFKRRKR